MYTLLLSIVMSTCSLLAMDGQRILQFPDQATLTTVLYQQGYKNFDDKTQISFLLALQKVPQITANEIINQALIRYNTYLGNFNDDLLYSDIRSLNGTKKINSISEHINVALYYIYQQEKIRKFILSTAVRKNS